MATKKKRRYTEEELYQKVAELDDRTLNCVVMGDNMPVSDNLQPLKVAGEKIGISAGKKGLKVEKGFEVGERTFVVHDEDTTINSTYNTITTGNIGPTPSVNKETEFATVGYITDNDLITRGSANFVLEDGDGTEVTVNTGAGYSNEVKFIEGENIDINWTDTDNGTDGDPYDLTFGVKIPYVLYSNFQDDLGTSKHYLPLRDVFEQTFPGSEQANTLIPFNMTLQKVVMRSNTDISGATWTLGMFTVDSGSNDAHHHTNGRNWVTATGGVAYTNAIFDFTGTIGSGADSTGGSNAVTAGQLIDFQLFASSDVTSSLSEFWFSFLFHVDMSNTI